MTDQIEGKAIVAQEKPAIRKKMTGKTSKKGESNFREGCHSFPCTEKCQRCDNHAHTGKGQFVCSRT